MRRTFTKYPSNYIKASQSTYTLTVHDITVYDDVMEEIKNQGIKATGELFDTGNMFEDNYFVINCSYSEVNKVLDILDSWSVRCDELYNRDSSFSNHDDINEAILSGKRITLDLKITEIDDPYYYWEGYEEHLAFFQDKSGREYKWQAKGFTKLMNRLEQIHNENPNQFIRINAQVRKGESGSIDLITPRLVG